MGAVLLGAVWPAAQTQPPSSDLIVGRNVNMVSGQQLPNGDPYLQRQNEPSVAASTRNPLHLLAGANDYRTVDIPGNFDDGETGDAWLGVFKSFDGGERWQSTLLPGYPQDTSAEGMASPLKAYHAGADPVVRPGTNGLLYYAGLAFNRGEGGASAIFVSRFVDNNNKENGDPIAYISTSIVAKSTGAAFLDKPWMAVDVPRAGARVCRISTQQPAPIVTPPPPGTSGRRRDDDDDDRRRGRSGDRHGAIGRLVSQIAKTIKDTRSGKGKPPLPVPSQQPRTVTQQVFAGTMYVAYAAITTTRLATGASDIESRIMFSRSEDCGATWTTPVRISDPAHKVNQGATIAIDPTSGAVHVAWRQFGLDETAPDAIMSAASENVGKTFRKPRRAYQFPTSRKKDQLLPKLQRAHRLGDVKELVSIKPFDSGTAEDRFRTNAYPTIAIDDESRVYLAWVERGYGGRPLMTGQDPNLEGDARVVLSTSRNGGVWTSPQPVDSGAFAGHQMMPSMSYSGGRLMMIYYDLRQDVSQVFGPWVDENDAVYTQNKRHTIDVRAVQASKGDVPQFGASTLVSQYLMGNLRGQVGSQPQQLQFNAPNLPLFQLGSVPFMGDYIDIAPAPAFVQETNGRWIHNTASTSAPVFHAVWTDNRDVQKPKDGNWKNYTPPGGPTCADGQTGMRNQNVYSARLTMGLVAGSPGNTKPLAADTPRGFVVFAQNGTYQTKAFRLTIENQPVGGQASFDQLGLAAPTPLLLSVDVKVAPRSMVTRTVYATSSNAKEQVRVSVSEIDATSLMPVAGGLATRVILNPDISNPDISNPDISNPDISNPDISNAEVYNPDISNPDISNPDISNPDISNPDISNPDISNVRIANPDISNPDISNPDISNPDISNPDISNPDISNPDISNGSLTDVTWTIRNDGNTTAAFNVNLFLANQAAAAGGIKTQLVVHKTYKTPIAEGCVLKSQTQTVLVANVLNPTFLTAGDDTTFDPANPDISNTTLWLEPGGEGKITLRIVDPNPTDNITINPVTDVKPVVQADAVNTPDLGSPTPVPPSTPLPTDPVPPPAISLAFVAQPVNTLVNVPMSDITVSAVAGANPAAGVQVTLAIAINPSGGNLAGTVTTLTDAFGIATFSGIAVNEDGVNYRMSASASASGALPVLSNAFTIGAGAPPPPPAAAWSATGDGIVVLTDNGAVGGTPRMTYQRNGFPNFTGAWTLSSIAPAGGATRLDWEWTGFHSYCASAVQLQAFVNRGGLDVFVAPLLQESDNCVGARNPSAGFAFAGVTSVVVQAGDTYGFRLNGSHGDGTYALEGTFAAVVNGATAANPFVVTNASDGGPGSLRAAITAANVDVNVNTISFAIPGAWVHTIAPATPLPVITNPVVIDGLSQPGSASMAPMINLDGRFMLNLVSDNNDDLPGTNIGLAPGFEVVASDVTIRGLGLNRFPGPGVYVHNGTNNVRVEDNAIGAGVAGVPTWPANHIGVHLNYSTNHVITRNVISSAEVAGVLLVGGSGTSITGNRIGTSADGLTALPNLDNGITLYDGTNGTTIDGNLISGNGTIGQANGYGIDIQQSGGLAEVTNTVMTNNIIGLDATGNLLVRAVGDYVGAGPGFVNFGPVQRGNSGGGIRVQRSAGTQIGLPGNGNTISGNTTEGVRIEGAHSVAPVLRANRIGLDPTGTSARGNTSRGIEVDGSAAFIGQAGAGNGNVISGNIGDGVFANGDTVIENNLIGTTAAGTVALGNASLVDGGTPFSPGCCHSGVFVMAPNNAVRGNVVAGQNAHLQDSGIRSQGVSGQAPNLIEDNWVGTDQTGTLALGNGVGIGIYGDQSGTTIRRNVVAFNHYFGIWMTGGVEGVMVGGALPADGNEIRNNLSGVVVGFDLAAADSGNRILSNRITNHLWRGILLGGNHGPGNDAGDGDGGPNGQQNFPVLSNVSNAGVVTTVNYLLDSLQINATHTIQIFANTACHVEGYGEGARLVGSFLQVSDGAGDMAVVGAALTELVPAGQFLTATATDGNGNTSEFSQCVQVVAPPPGGVITSMTPSDQVAAGFGQLVFIRGTGMLGTGANDVLFSNGGPEFPAQYTWSAGPNLVVARLPTGVLAPGAASVRVRNAAQTESTAAYAFTLSNTPGAPVVNTVQSGCGTGAAINATTVGATISFHSEGVDTSGTTITWTGPGGTFNHGPTSTGGGISGSVMVCATVPVMAPGAYTVSITTTVSGQTSAASNSFVISVS
jgi:Right handed beta helix region